MPIDQTRADALIHEIASLIVNDPEFASRDWDGLAIVGIVGDSSSRVGGYSYDAAGESEAGAPQNRAIHKLLKELRAVMTETGKEPWKTCLFKIKKPDFKFSVDFEYQDAMRWKVSPANVEVLVAQMRP